MFNKLFGENYANKVDLFQNLYLRIMFLRGWIFDFPILILICYLIPWDGFYDYPLVQQLIQFMEANIRNVAKNRINSDFPEYAVTYLSIIHVIGVLSLILPFVFSVESSFFVKNFYKTKANKMKIMLCGVFSIIIFLGGVFYPGAITYFGCDRCSYHHPLSLIAGAILCWICLHYCLMGTILCYRAILFIKRSETK